AETTPVPPSPVVRMISYLPSSPDGKRSRSGTGSSTARATAALSDDRRVSAKASERRISGRERARPQAAHWIASSALGRWHEEQVSIRRLKHILFATWGGNLRHSSRQPSCGSSGVP